MTAFLHIWDAIKPYGVLVGSILIAVALVLAAASSRSLIGHWLGLRVGAPRDRVAEVLTLHEQREQTIRDAIKAEAERLYPGMPHLGMHDGMVWPDDLCSAPTCSPEDGGVCDHHQRLETGRHRLGSSQSRGHEVIQAIVTDLPEPWDSRWSR